MDFIQFEHLARIGDDGREFAVVAYHAGVFRELLDILLVEIRHSLDVKALEGFAGIRPFAFDDLPGHAGLKDGLAHDLKIIVQGFGGDFDWWVGRHSWLPFSDFSDLGNVYSSFF